jgi:hypothetical protein
MPQMPMMPPPPEKRYDVKIKRCTAANGRMKVEVLAPEDFLIERAATVLTEKIRFVGHRINTMTRSDLKLAYPDKKKIIDGLPTYSNPLSSGIEKQSRDSRFLPGREDNLGDPATEVVEIFEVYVLVDYDGDGVAERRQVVLARSSDERHLLANNEWAGDLPFTDIVPDPMPHRWAGRSVFDETYDVMRIKTVLLRQTLDNLYQVNNPQQEADHSRIMNPDAVVNRELGGTIWKKGGAEPAIIPNIVPFVAKETFPVLDYLDGVIESRTGIGKASMALDLDAMQNQTATAVNAQQSAAYSKVETYARNIAECGGFKRLFKCMLRLFVENQKSVKRIKLRNQWVEMDPRGWNADMDCFINVGLGAGSRDRDQAMLQGIAAKQELVIQTMGPTNPACNVGHVFETYRKMTEAAGLKNPEQFFPEITQEQVQQFAAQQAQQPHPEAAKAQAQKEIEQMKLQANMQLEQARMQADGQRDAQKFQMDQGMMQQKAEIEKIQAQADIATQDKKTEAEIMLAREKFQLEATLRQQEHQMRMAELQAESARKEQEFQFRAVESANNAQMAREGHEQKMTFAEHAAKNKQPKGEN